MARMLAAVAVFLFLLSPAGWARYDPDFPNLTKKDRTAIRQVVEAQLDAFRHDDAHAAFSYATPTVQRRFRSPEEFLAFVRSVYPAVYRAHDVEFRRIRITEAGPVQVIYLLGPGSQPLLGHYLMEQQPDGQWKIDACRVTAASGTGI